MESKNQGRTWLVLVFWGRFVFGDSGAIFRYITLYYDILLYFRCILRFFPSILRYFTLDYFNF